MSALTHEQMVAAVTTACESLLPFVVPNLEKMGVTKESMSDAVMAASDQEYDAAMRALYFYGATQSEATTLTAEYLKVFKSIFETKLREQLKFED